MYLPYIRAKQYDLTAIAETKDSIFLKKSVIPIIEPIASIKKNQFKKIADKKIPFVLVVNPIVGDLKSNAPNAEIISALVEDVFKGDENCTLAFIIQQQTTLAQIKSFIGAFPDHKHAFIHFFQFSDARELAKIIAADKNTSLDIFIDGRVSLDYINLFTVSDAPDILIRDGFVKKPKNELYPAEDFFSDLHRQYKKMGYQGFGDFTVIGSQFEKGGGRAYVVALHLTDKDSDKNLVVKHFKSDPETPPSAVDPGGKFKKALGRLKKYVDSSGLTSDGVTEFLEYHSTGHFPGLGVPKKISIKHHIEIVATFL